MEEALKWVPLAQVITTAVLTLVGLCVTLASLLVAYRNNFGWKPIIIIPGWHMKSMRLPGDTSTHSYRDLFDNTAVIPIEVWNRRKYPIVVRGLSIEIAEKVEFEVVPPRTGGHNGWHMNSQRASLTDSVTIAPSSHHLFECEIPFRTATFDGMRARMDITLSYFDPRKNKRYETTAVQKYGFKD